MLKSILGLSPAVFAGLFATCLLTACSEGETTCTDGESCEGSDGDGTGDGADASKPKPKDGGAKSDAKVPSTSDAGVLASKKYLPCDVKTIVEDKCALCHGAEPSFGAPMALVTAADFQAIGDDKRAMYATVKDKINESKPALKMPPTTNDQLSADELKKLNDWLDSGAPGAEKQCSTGGGSDAGTPDSGVKPDDGPYTEPKDEDLTCYKMVAHNGDKKTPFKAGVLMDAYYTFTFKAPWPETAYGIVMKSVIDNKKALHHWLLFGDGAPGVDGAIVRQIGAHPGGQLLAAWAPGADPMDFRTYNKGVGLELPGGINTYTLEIHYNSADANAVDASGVEVCIANRKPTNIAAYSWLGNDNLGLPSTYWKGTCTPFAQKDPIHIVSFMPHMHLTGTHMKGTINRANGTKEVVHDADFSFEYQKSYPVDLTLMPGDSLTTECNYSVPQVFGQPTDKEMCYLFSMAYPKGALAMPDAWGGVAHGTSSCLGQ